MSGDAALVTGGASGIGLACVRRLAADGWRVAVLDADAKAPAADGAALTLRADVRDEQAVAQAVDEAAARLGSLRALVCCAGVVRLGDVTQTSLEDWRLQFDVNVLGTMLSARAAIPHLRRAGGGAIVTIASNLALVADAGVAAYCASKAAVLGLTRAMALDHVRDGIRVNAVCPGPTRTPLFDRVMAEVEAAGGGDEGGDASSGAPLHDRLVEPDEVADAVAYLVSPRAGSTIGAVLSVDGGYTVR